MFASGNPCATALDLSTARNGGQLVMAEKRKLPTHLVKLTELVPGGNIRKFALDQAKG